MDQIHKDHHSYIQDNENYLHHQFEIFQRFDYMAILYSNTLQYIHDNMLVHSLSVLAHPKEYLNTNYYN